MKEKFLQAAAEWFWSLRSIDISQLDYVNHHYENTGVTPQDKLLNAIARFVKEDSEETNERLGDKFISFGNLLNNPKSSMEQICSAAHDLGLGIRWSITDIETAEGGK